MQQTLTLFGTHVFFAREGTTIATPADAIPTGTTGALVTRDRKPGPNDTTWLDFGNVEKIDFERKSTEVEDFGPSPGRMVLRNILETKRELDLKFEVSESSNLVREILFGAAALPASPAAGGQFTPLGGPTKRGWLKIQEYSQETDAIVETHDLWCYVKIGSLSQGVEKPTYTVEARLLWSSLNTSSLS